MLCFFLIFSTLSTVIQDVPQLPPKPEIHHVEQKNETASAIPEKTVLSADAQNKTVPTETLNVTEKPNPSTVIKENEIEKIKNDENNKTVEEKPQTKEAVKKEEEPQKVAPENPKPEEKKENLTKIENAQKVENNISQPAEVSTGKEQTHANESQQNELQNVDPQNPDFLQNGTLFDRDHFIDDDDQHFNINERRDANGTLICGPNAHIEGSICMCNNESYVGNPYTEEGCYTCKNVCSNYAFCSYPGVCQCFDQYTGNGSKCYQITPDVNAIVELNTTHVLVRHIFRSDSHMTTGFCKFNDAIVQATNITDDSMVCQIPVNLPDQSLFKISTNAESWSDEDVYFEKKTNGVKPRSGNKGLIAVFLLSMLFVSILMSNTKAPKKSEAEPFIQEKPKPGDCIDEEEPLPPQDLDYIMNQDNEEEEAVPEAPQQQPQVQLQQVQVQQQLQQPQPLLQAQLQQPEPQPQLQPELQQAQV